MKKERATTHPEEQARLADALKSIEKALAELPMASRSPSNRAAATNSSRHSMGDSSVMSGEPVSPPRNGTMTSAVDRDGPASPMATTPPRPNKTIKEVIDTPSRSPKEKRRSRRRSSSRSPSIPRKPRTPTKSARISPSRIKETPPRMPKQASERSLQSERSLRKSPPRSPEARSPSGSPAPTPSKRGYKESFSDDTSLFDELESFDCSNSGGGTTLAGNETEGAEETGVSIDYSNETIVSDTDSNQANTDDFIGSDSCTFGFLSTCQEMENYKECLEQEKRLRESVLNQARILVHQARVKLQVDEMMEKYKVNEMCEKMSEVYEKAKVGVNKATELASSHLKQSKDTSTTTSSSTKSKTSSNSQRSKRQSTPLRRKRRNGGGSIAHLSTSTKTKLANKDNTPARRAC